VVILEANKGNVHCVYMHTNKINNKVYIGQTGKSVSDRWGKGGSGYLKRRKDGSYFQPLFARAIIKYGWGNFEHIVFVECLSKSDACHIEKLLIAMYKSNNSMYGYNLSSGGESGSAGIVMSDEQKRKISKARKKCWEDEQYRLNQIESHKWQTGENHPFYGKHHTEETRMQLSQKAKERFSDSTNHPFYGKHIFVGDDNPFYGKTHSEESRQKISEANNGKNNGRARKIVQYDKHGNLIKIWGCIKDASVALGINYTSIGACCNGRQKTAGGFIWKYFIEEDFDYAKSVGF
jgi:group I intron endonuclease